MIASCGRKFSVRPEKKKRQPKLALVKFWKAVLRRAEDGEAAARHDGHDFTAAISERRVGFVKWIGRQAGLIAFGPDGIGRNIVGGNRVVGRDGEGDDFVNADADAGHGFVEAREEAAGASGGSTPNASLFHGAAHIAHADGLADIVHTAAKFLFRTGAATSQQGNCGNGSKEGERFTHNGL